jgi:hypothetical protein
MEETAQIRRFLEAWLRDARAVGIGGLASRPDGASPAASCEFDLAALQATLRRDDAAADGRQDIQEILIVGDWAFLRTYRCHRSTTDDGAIMVERAGYRLSVLHREDGSWRLARDPERFLTLAPGAPPPS